MSLWDSINRAAREQEQDKRTLRERANRMSVDLEKARVIGLSHITTTADLTLGTTIGQPIDTIQDRVTKLEGYMPILLDKLEEQHEQIEKMDRAYRELYDFAHDASIYKHHGGGK